MTPQGPTSPPPRWQEVLIQPSPAPCGPSMCPRWASACLSTKWGLECRLQYLGMEFEEGLIKQEPRRPWVREGCSTPRQRREQSPFSLSQVVWDPSDTGTMNKLLTLSERGEPHCVASPPRPGLPCGQEVPQPPSRWAELPILEVSAWIS